jgi:hypothetical protein
MMMCREKNTCCPGLLVAAATKRKTKFGKFCPSLGNLLRTVGIKFVEKARDQLSTVVVSEASTAEYLLRNLCGTADLAMRCHYARSKGAQFHRIIDQFIN